MIINKKSGDDLALSFRKLMSKSLEKKASSVSAGKMLVEDEHDNNLMDEHQNQAHDQHSNHGEDGRFSAENFMISPGGQGDKDVLENSLEDSISLFEDEDDEEEEGIGRDHYEQNLGNLIGKNVDMMGDELHEKEAKAIMRGLGKIASSLSRKGERFASDVVVAAAKDISSEIEKEHNKRAFVKSELYKMARELKSEGDSFSSDMVLATLKSI